MPDSPSFQLPANADWAFNTVPEGRASIPELPEEPPVDEDPPPEDPPDPEEFDPVEVEPVEVDPPVPVVTGGRYIGAGGVPTAGQT